MLFILFCYSAVRPGGSDWAGGPGESGGFCGFDGPSGFSGSNGSIGPRGSIGSGRSFGSCGPCESCGSNGLIDSAWLGRPGVLTLAVYGHLLAISLDPKVFLNGSRVFDGP